MSHPEQREFFERLKSRFPHHFKNVVALDVGSLDINGNLRDLFDIPSWYIGLDLIPGKNVDVVCPAHLYRTGFKFNTVLSAECFEHDMYWMQTFQNMIDLTQSGGFIAFSCATTGRPPHGVSYARPQDAPGLSQMGEVWGGYYRNLTEEDFRQMPLGWYFDSYEFEVNEASHDLYFWGLRK